MTKRKEENYGRKKILAAFLMLMITAIALTTASYAWFTENTTITVASLNVTVGASNGIQVSSNATAWKRVLENTDLTTNAYIGNTNIIPTELSAVSTGKTLTSGKLNFFKGQLTEGCTTSCLVAPPIAEPTASATVAAASLTGDFIAFDMFIQASQAETLKLTAASDIIATGGTANDTGLKNASRVAFVKEGTAATPTAAIALNGGTAATTFIWEPNSNVHTAAAITNAAAYGVTLTAAQVLASYRGIQAEIPADTHQYTAASATYFATVTPDYQTLEANAALTTVFGVTAGITKVRVYIWVEGEDYDCENEASGKGLTINIQLQK